MDPITRLPLLKADAISALLPVARRIGREIVVMTETGSTNDEATQLGRAGAADGLVLFAERQTAGRGRLGRKWESAAHQGLWFSLLLRPAFALADWSRLTTWAAVGIARGIEEALPGCRAAIKWPNDIYLGGKKAVGILCESVAGPCGYAVVGIGVNINHTRSDFPEELHTKATSLRETSGAPLERHTVAAALLRQLDALYPALENDFASVVAEAEARSFLVGRRITVHGPQETYEATAEGLEPDGSLRVWCAEGVTRLVCGGEVSVSACACLGATSPARVRRGNRAGIPSRAD
ncbi:MAG: biotin--[acetyl-CoA-carboxylase] ligase [Verrucomicrobia bacterium]|nr:biotin--[acetyl-CoA-carboxylase] ligase [Verrucomicrobiota bacterium]